MRTEAQDRVIVLAVLLALPAAASAEVPTGSTLSQAKAQYHWVLHCQGCHGADARGIAGSVPRLAGNVARFLHINAGRAYLARVPGVAFVDLSDDEVAELLNWVVHRFDEGHLPKTFTPYAAEEIRALRREPLISGAYSERQKILQTLSRGQ